MPSSFNNRQSFIEGYVDGFNLKEFNRKSPDEDAEYTNAYDYGVESGIIHFKNLRDNLIGISKSKKVRSINQLNFMLSLSSGPKRQTRIAAILGVTREAIRQMSNLLEKEGLVIKKDDNLHTDIHLTEKGLKLIKEIIPKQLSCQRKETTLENV